MKHEKKDCSYLTDDDVCQILSINIQSLRNKIHLGHPLPPYILPPASRKRLWPRKEFHDWLASFIVQETSVNSLEMSKIKRKRGIYR